MIISKTPVRISLFGGGTDYPDYFNRCKGAVLGTTINKYIYLSINKLSSFFDYKVKVSYSLSEKVSNLDEIQHPSVRECLRFMNMEEGLDIHHFADLPARTGLGSSSSFTVGLLNAIYMLQEKKVPKKILADNALHVEQQLINERVGSQDQVHAAFGGLNLIEFDQNGYKVFPIDIDDPKRSLIEDSLLLFYTGINRFANDILEEQIKNTNTRSKDSYLKTMLKMVYDAKEMMLALKGHNLIQNLGTLLHQSWECKKQLSSKISNPQINYYYNLAKTAGAIGGKLCGAGHGGFLLLMVPKEKQDTVRDALKELLEVDFKFEQDGSQIIYQQ